MAEESRAAGFFTRKGWNLLARNFSCRTGEIDLIFSDDKNVVVFVEVRYRSGQSHGTAQASISRSKISRIVKTAVFYIKENNLFGRDFRFDVAAVSPEGLDHIPNAFQAGGYTI